jgi:hypothetical protein
MNLWPLLPQRLSSKEREGSRCLRSVERSPKPLPGPKRPLSPRLERAREKRSTLLNSPQAVPRAGSVGRLDRCRAPFTVLAALFLSGCRGAPSINVLGSFFPGWMLCMGLGLLGALVFRQIFIKTNVESQLVLRPLVYLCLWGMVTLSSWLLFFRS